MRLLESKRGLSSCQVLLLETYIMLDVEVTKFVKHVMGIVGCIAALLATEVRRQTASSRLKQQKSIIVCWCSISSWCYIQGVFHMLSYCFIMQVA